MTKSPNFSEFRAWLASTEYAEEMKKLVGNPPASPRDEWPIDREALARQHEAHATMCIDAAARHMRSAKELRKET